MPDMKDLQSIPGEMKWQPGQQEAAKAFAEKIIGSGMNQEELVNAGLITAPVPWGELQQSLLVAYDLKQAREKAGLTILDVCARSRLDKSQISKLENGLANPTIETISRYVAALGKRFRLVLEDVPTDCPA